MLFLQPGDSATSVCAETASRYRLNYAHPRPTSEVLGLGGLSNPRAVRKPSRSWTARLQSYIVNLVLPMVPRSVVAPRTYSLYYITTVQWTHGSHRNRCRSSRLNAGRRHKDGGDTRSSFSEAENPR
jgi:hypothetical protein